MKACLTVISHPSYFLILTAHCKKGQTWRNREQSHIFKDKCIHIYACVIHITHALMHQRQDMHAGIHYIEYLQQW